MSKQYTKFIRRLNEVKLTKAGHFYLLKANILARLPTHVALKAISETSRVIDDWTWVPASQSTSVSKPVDTRRVLHVIVVYRRVGLEDL